MTTKTTGHAGLDALKPMRRGDRALEIFPRLFSKAAASANSHSGYWRDRTPWPRDHPWHVAAWLLRTTHEDFLGRPNAQRVHVERAWTSLAYPVRRLRDERLRLNAELKTWTDPKRDPDYASMSPGELASTMLRVCREHVMLIVPLIADGPSDGETKGAFRERIKKEHEQTKTSQEYDAAYAEFLERTRELERLKANTFPIVDDPSAFMENLSPSERVALLDGYCKACGEKLPTSQTCTCWRVAP